ncbi:MAG: hypothetical protein ACW98Y_08690, partial [Candidatus Thorarchaeota archaeon]
MKSIHIFLLILLLDGGFFLLNAEESDEGESIKIVFDYSHGQNLQTEVWNETDPLIEGNLTEMGYEVVWARGGLNETVLVDADGLVLGSIWANMGFLQYEITAISTWFNQGGKFLWVACDNDYEGRYINDNMTSVLEAVESHVYPEPCEVEDFECCCREGFGYRVYSPRTSNDSFVSEIVEGVERVLLHGPTLLYGSQTSVPGVHGNPVVLESQALADVYPLLYFSPSAIITRAQHPDLVVHEMNQTGSFVACTLEMTAGESNRGVLIVSSASPYGDYQPMWTESYYDADLNGYVFVRQTIE